MRVELHVDQAALEAAIEGYRAEPTVWGDRLAEFLYRIATGVALHWGLPDPDEAAQEAVFQCLRQLHHYDPARGKAFNFLYSICHQSNSRTIKSQRRQSGQRLIDRLTMPSTFVGHNQPHERARQYGSRLYRE